jgi:fructokinase
MKALIKKGAKFVIVSMGAEGLIAGTKEITLKMPALNVSVVDPSGAGDAFCAGLIYGFIKTTHGERHETLRLPSKGLTSILLEGEAAGAACVTAVGTTTAVTRENVNRLLREQGSAILERVQCVGSR